MGILGFGGAAAMVHPASGYMVGGLLRRSPSVSKVIAKAMLDKNASPSSIAKEGWEAYTKARDISIDEK